MNTVLGPWESTSSSAAGFVLILQGMETQSTAARHSVKTVMPTLFSARVIVSYWCMYTAEVVAPCSTSETECTVLGQVITSDPWFCEPMTVTSLTEAFRHVLRLLPSAQSIPSSLLMLLDLTRTS